MVNTVLLDFLLMQSYKGLISMELYEVILQSLNEDEIGYILQSVINNLYLWLDDNVVNPKKFFNC